MHLIQKIKPSLDKYIKIAKEVYPEDQAWDDYEMDFITKTTYIRRKISIL
jgi:hypothetical protein